VARTLARVGGYRARRRSHRLRCEAAVPEPTTPSDIGATLREARERQGLTIADCAERTRIRAKYIQALEEEKYGSMPEQAYARGFLRTYAVVLGLEPDELVAEFNRKSEPAGVGGDSAVLELRSREPQSGVPERRRKPPSRRRPRIGWLLLGAAVAVLLVVVAERSYGAEAGPADHQPVAAPAYGDYFSR
jgi:cytoskeleton protein RodZ